MSIMKTVNRVAQVIIDALPYIKEFQGQSVVIKYGGSAMKEEHLKRAFAKNVVLMSYIGLNPIIVHGGGPQINKMLDRLGIEACFREGLRVTDQPTMDVVEMVLTGSVNKEIVNLINLNGGRAVGLSGKDGHFIKAVPHQVTVNRDNAPPEIIDLGKVGRVAGINTGILSALKQNGFIPVIAPVGVDEAGETYNINADLVAAAVASALGAKRLILLTDVPGVLNPAGQTISSMTVDQAKGYLKDGTISGGMIPKINCCLDALTQGVRKVSIIDGRVENSIILELFTVSGLGTEITATGEE